MSGHFACPVFHGSPRSLREASIRSRIPQAHRPKRQLDPNRRPRGHPAQHLATPARNQPEHVRPALATKRKRPFSATAGRSLCSSAETGQTIGSPPFVCYDSRHREGYIEQPGTQGGKRAGCVPQARTWSRWNSKKTASDLLLTCLFLAPFFTPQCERTMIPNVFISSTIADLHYLRDGLRDLLGRPRFLYQGL